MWLAGVQGDLNHWVELLNHLDDTLERAATALDPTGGDQAGPAGLPALTVEALRVTRMLLENCRYADYCAGDPIPSRVRWLPP